MNTHNYLLTAISFFTNFNPTPLTVNDWVDIMVMTVLIALVIRLLIEARSLSVALGIIGLGFLYGASIFFKLPLTHLVLHSFFGFFLIFIAIIFQEELRRLFSLVGFLSFPRFEPPTKLTINEIVKTVSRMASNRIGALIVFPGRESVARFLERGIALDGKVSEEALLSIFDNKSPGHDGAVLINGNKIDMFALHLPLAENANNLKRSGLRHRAAIGLSEKTDALVIVVSEEAGTIGIARGGQISYCSGEDDLRGQLLAFSHATFPREDWFYFLRWVFDGAWLLIISFAIALVAWLLIIR